MAQDSQQNSVYIMCMSLRVAVCCGVLQCVAVWHRTHNKRAGILCVCLCVLQCVAVCCCVLQCVAVCCSVLQCDKGPTAKERAYYVYVSACYSVLQCVAVCCSVLQCDKGPTTKEQAYCMYVSASTQAYVHTHIKSNQRSCARAATDEQHVNSFTHICVA